MYCTFPINVLYMAKNSSTNGLKRGIKQEDNETTITKPKFQTDKRQNQRLRFKTNPPLTTNSNHKLVPKSVNSTPALFPTNKLY